MALFSGRFTASIQSAKLAHIATAIGHNINNGIRLNMSRNQALLVDPNNETREFLAQDLAEDSYEVTACVLGLDALNKCLTKAFDLVLVERNLNDIDSMQLCREILGTPHNSEAVIMVISSWEDQHERNMALDNGAVDYITKPFHYPDLSERFKKALGKDH